MFDLSVSGVADFKVAAGGEVHCHTTCRRGSETTVAYNLGSAVTGSGDTDGETDEDCEMTTKFTADEDQFKFGWKVTTEGNYDNLALTCYW